MTVLKKYLTLALAGALALTALPGSAAGPHQASPPQPENPDPPPHQHQIPPQKENRFLFIVETSSSMRGCSNVILQDMVGLLESGMKGELRDGDTIGLWTYSDKLHLEFPMQIWSKADPDNTVILLASYLEDMHYGRRGHLENVLPALNQVIKNSDRVTVVLFSDGNGMIQGTPFDKEINVLQKKYGRDLRANHVPFITVLAARQGGVFDYAVDYPGLIDIPHTALPDKPVEKPTPVVETPAPAPAPASPPKPLRSLIMVAPRRAAPAPEVAQATPIPVAPPPAPAEPLPVAASTPAPVPVAAPAVAPPVASVTVTPPPTRVEALPPQAAPSPTPAPAPEPVAPVAVKQNSPAVVTAPVEQAAAPAAPVAVNNPAPAPTAAPPVVQPAPVASVAVPASGSETMMFVMAFSLLTIAVVLVVFMVRRSRGAPQSSLISQSLDHRSR